MAHTLGVLVVVMNALSGSPATELPAPFTLGDYEFIPPQGWQVQRQGNHVRMQNMESGCLILLTEPQPSSGNLEQDAMAVFDMMYKGWQPRKDGPQRFLMSKGVLPKGMPFVLIEALMGKLNPDGASFAGFEDGAALVVGSGNQYALIAVRHSDLPGHVSCLRYEGWRRFFNSFTLKNVPIAKTADDGARRIVGRWSSSESGAAGDYTFAGNGRYSYGGVGASSGQHPVGFEGDGSYSVSGSRLTMMRRGAQAEQVAIRFVQVNQGGTGWIERLCMVRADAMGMENEACYRRQDR
jgi:hypothetical protein